MAAARFLSAGTPLYLYARLSGCPSPTLRQWKSAAIAGTLMLGAANGLVTWSEVYVPSGLAALLVATVPFCMTLLDWIARHRAAAGDRFPEKVTAFHDAMAVHGRFRKPCPVCGSPVQRIVYAANESNYCPTCQTGGRLLADRALSRLLGVDWPRSLEELEELKSKAGGV